MIKIIGIVLQLLGVSAGVFFGLKMKFPESAEMSNHGDYHGDGDDDHGNDKGDKKGHGGDDHGKKDKKKGSHAKDDGHGDGEAYGFLKFGRQFIVPVIENNGTNALMIIDINLEVAPSATEIAYSQEPKLRDALLRALLTASNDGLFSAQLIEGDNLEVIRSRLLKAVRKILDDDVSQVLILSVARQNV